MEQPAVEVRFQSLHVETSLYTESARNLPTILNAYRDALEVCLPYRQAFATEPLFVARSTVLCHDTG